MANDEPRLLNVASAASFLGVNPSTIRQWAAAKKLPGVKIGSRGDWRFTKDALLTMLHGTSVQDESKNTSAAYPDQAYRYHAVLASSIVDAVVSTDTSYMIVSWNKGAEDVYGWKADEVIGKSAIDILKTEFPTGEKGRRDSKQAVKDRGAWKGEVIQQKRDGTRIHILASVSPVIDENDTLIGTVAVNRDITDRKKVEESLLIERERLKNLFHQAPALIAILRGEEGICELMNPFFSQMWGNRPVLGKSMREAWPELAGQGWFEMVETIQKTGQSIVGTEKLAIADWDNTGKQTTKYFNFIYSPYFVEKDSVDGVMIFGYEVTEQVVARKKAEESEAYYQQMMNTLPVITWVTDSKGKCTFLNKQWYDYTGQTPNQAVGFGWLDAVHPNDSERSSKIFLEGTKKKKPVTYEYRLRKYDGTYRWMLDAGLPKFSSDGTFEGFVGSVVDIHDRKISEERLQKLSKQQEETLAQLESLLRYAPIGFAFFDKEHRYIRINDALAEINGIPAADHLEKKIEDLLPVNAKAVVPVLEQVFTTGEPVVNIEVSGETPKEIGIIRHWLTGFYPVFIGDSNDVNLVGAVVIEITERKKLEQQKDEFIGVASHELKTPVTSIKAYTQVLQKSFEKKGDLRSVELLSKMDNQLNKLTVLISDLLDVTKIQAGKLQFRMEHFDVHEVIREVVEEIQRTSDHRISLSLAPSNTLYGDRDRIGQVITNLLTNAIKYSPNASEVIVKTTTNKNHVVFAVQDFGTGIPKEKHEQIFERFYRIEGDTALTFPGLGLGLYISREIITRHHGKIWVTSEEGHGATFSFSLPLYNIQKD